MKKSGAFFKGVTAALTFCALTLCAAGCGGVGAKGYEYPLDISYDVVKYACEGDIDSLMELYYPPFIDAVAEYGVENGYTETKEEALEVMREDIEDSWFYEELYGQAYDPANVDFSDMWYEHGDPEEIADEYEFYDLADDIDDVVFFDVYYTLEDDDALLDFTVVEVDGRWYLIEVW